METKPLTKKQIYRKEYNQRPDVIEKRKEYNQRPDVFEKRSLCNKKLRPCECGGYFTHNHKKQHLESPIHKNYVENGIKYELPESQKNKLFYNEKC